MSYQTGSSTGVADLLDKVRAFAVSLGWTVMQWDTGSTQRWLSLHLTGTDQYVNLQSPIPVTGNGYVTIVMARGYSGASAWNAQTQTSAPTSIDLGTSGFTNYFFFGDSTLGYLYVVVEVSAGVFRHFGFGTLNKAGVYNKGGFIYGTNYVYNQYYTSNPENQYYSYIPFDAGSIYWTNCPVVVHVEYLGYYYGCVYNSSWYTPPANSQLHVLGATRAGSWNYSRWNRSPNNFNGLSVLLPMPLHLQVESGLYRPLGEPIDMRYVNMRNMSPKDEITLGTDTWKVFPAVTLGVMPANTAMGQPTNTGYHAFAYKKTL